MEADDRAPSNPASPGNNEDIAADDNEATQKIKDSENEAVVDDKDTANLDTQVIPSTEDNGEVTANNDENLETIPEDEMEEDLEVKGDDVEDPNTQFVSVETNPQQDEDCETPSTEEKEGENVVEANNETDDGIVAEETRDHKRDPSGEVEDEQMEVEESDGIEDQPDHDNDANSQNEGVVTRKRTLSHSSVDEGPRRKVGRNAGAQQGDNSSSKHDKYCWVCHKEGVQVNCKLCPRSYHSKCMTLDYPNAKLGEGDSSYPCPECVVVMNAETLELRSEAMKQLTLDQLMGLLKNICLRMRQTPGSEPFVHPVDPTDAEDYFDYIIYPMDIETLEKNIKKRLYGSTEGFLADAQWLVHNSIVFNSASSMYTLAAKRLLKVCKMELTEIETCPECYTNAHEKPDSWFVEACRRPHLLVWAKLKGFPFWPAKAMKIKDNDVDVRFFGQHDRAWVSMKDCFLYSEEMPVAPPKKNGPLLSAIEELTAHVEKLKEVHGDVIFAPVKTPIGSQLSTENIRRMLPDYKPLELQCQSATTTKSVGSTSNNNNNNNNSSSNKVPPPAKKSPMTIRISSLKTNPTIVNISAPIESNSTSTPTSQTEGRVLTRLTRKSSAAAVQSSQNQSSHNSESELSNSEDQSSKLVENKEEDVEAEEDDEEEDEEEEQEQDEAEEPEVPANNEPESVPEAEAKSEAEDEALPTVPKGSEILANALGGALRRSTRGLSRSGENNAASSEATAQSLTPTLEKRLTRGTNKTPPDTGYEADSNGDQGSDEQPPDTVLEAMGLSKKTKESPGQVQTSVIIKGEITDHDDSEESGLEHNLIKTANSANNLMEQLTSNQTTIKPGYRFNLSKDISISAVDGATGGDQQDDKISTPYGGVNGKGRRINIVPGSRIGPQGLTVGVATGGNLRPRVPVNINANLVNGGQPQPKLFTGPQLRQMVRNARPQHILNPRTGQTVRVAGVNSNRPMSLLSGRGPQQSIQTIQKTTKDGALVVEASNLNPVQGPITLPGGTITVTPLTSIIGNVPLTGFDADGAQVGQQQVTLAIKPGASTSNVGVLNVQTQQAGSSTMNVKGVKPIQTTVTAATTAQQRRQLMGSIPSSVNMHLQHLTKTMSDLVKSTVEQMAFEIVECCNSAQGKAENSRLQVEIERLQNKLKQEVTDVKHNNDIAMRELRMTMENDKKRALAELKRQMELEKQKAIEETKKKQWCANCGREALFYCCWNTSYCGYSCQEDHWPTHMSSCSQGSANSR